MICPICSETVGNLPKHYWKKHLAVYESGRWRCMCGYSSHYFVTYARHVRKTCHMDTMTYAEEMVKTSSGDLCEVQRRVPSASGGWTAGSRQVTEHDGICPLCKEAVCFPDSQNTWQLMWEHMAKSHAERYMDGCFCAVCGADYTTMPHFTFSESYRAHMLEHGGVWNHYRQYLLGVYDGQE